MNRARSPEAKQARREEILGAAVDLLSRERFEHVTMAKVAQEAGVAKGTPYLYWRTKEELFLDALVVEYGGFLDALAVALRSATDPDAVGAAIVDEVHRRPRVVMLVGLWHPVLERNAPVEAIIAAKRMLLERALQISAVLTTNFEWLQLEPAMRILLRIHAALMVSRLMDDVPPAVAEALADPSLALLNVDVLDDLRGLVADLLIAARWRALEET